MHRLKAIPALLLAAALSAHAQEATPAKPPAWNVNTPPGVAKTATIDVKTGTWMSVDVSPDGKTVVFDLLGDLYTLPIAGGEATPLTHSLAWEMQPRWSPDGQRIAFNVRSGGGFAIAVMDLGGGGGRIVAQGENPVWGADSRHLVYSTGSSISLLDVPTGKSIPVISGLGKVTEPTWTR